MLPHRQGARVIHGFQQITVEQIVGAADHDKEQQQAVSQFCVGDVEISFGKVPGSIDQAGAKDSNISEVFKQKQRVHHHLPVCL